MYLMQFNLIRINNNNFPANANEKYCQKNRRKQSGKSEEKNQKPIPNHHCFRPSFPSLQCSPAIVTPTELHRVSERYREIIVASS